MNSRERVIAISEAMMTDLGRGESFANVLAADLRLDHDDAMAVMTTFARAMEELDWPGAARKQAASLGIDWDSLSDDHRGKILRGVRDGAVLAFGTRMAVEARLLPGGDWDGPVA